MLGRINMRVKIVNSAFVAFLCACAMSIGRIRVAVLDLWRMIKILKTEREHVAHGTKLCPQRLWLAEGLKNRRVSEAGTGAQSWNIDEPGRHPRRD